MRRHRLRTERPRGRPTGRRRLPHGTGGATMASGAPASVILTEIWLARRQRLLLVRKAVLDDWVTWVVHLIPRLARPAALHAGAKQADRKGVSQQASASQRARSWANADGLQRHRQKAPTRIRVLSCPACSAIAQ